jgi:hypothetical protein
VGQLSGICGITSGLSCLADRQEETDKGWPLSFMELEFPHLEHHELDLLTSSEIGEMAAGSAGVLIGRTAALESEAAKSGHSGIHWIAVVREILGAPTNEPQPKW